jgi:hypothetical protein
MKKRKPVIAILAATLVCSLTLAGDAWVHVSVDSTDADGESVRVSLPFSLVETLLPMIDVKPLHEGRLVLDDLDLEGFDLRAVLTELAQIDDADFVKVRDGDETVSVSKRGDFLHVDVDQADGGERVQLRVPMSIVDAMLASEGEPNSLDLASAMRALSAFEGDLISVQGGQETVRIWIDSSNGIDE